jgi:hypothetical protein
MQITVTKDGEVYNMGYDPCHKQALIAYYRDALINGEIDGCLINGEPLEVSHL